MTIDPDVKLQADSLFWCLPAADAIVCREWQHAAQLGCVREHHPLSIDSDPDIHARIASLLSACRPAAIGRFVVTVYVDTVKGVVWRARSHVAQKTRKVLRPFVAHLDTATAVVAELLRSRTNATALRVLPRPILSRACQPMRCALLSGAVAPKAAATPRAPSGERRTRHNDCGPARAETQPMSLRLGMWGTARNSQPAERFTTKFNAPHTKDVTPNRLVWL